MIIISWLLWSIKIICCWEFLILLCSCRMLVEGSSFILTSRLKIMKFSNWLCCVVLMLMLMVLIMLLLLFLTFLTFIVIVIIKRNYNAKLSGLWWVVENLWLWLWRLLKWNTESYCDISTVFINLEGIISNFWLLSHWLFLISVVIISHYLQTCLYV